MATLYQTNKEFMDRVVQDVEGWLQQFAAISTMDLLDGQDARGVSGSYLEIGVYGGKYLSLLYRHAFKDGSAVVGLDPFSMLPQDQVVRNMEKVEAYMAAEAKPKLHLVKGFSTDFFAGDLLQLLGQRPRFISVDGSHQKQDVYWDLGLSNELLGAGGILAIDDYLSPYNLGVNEAVNQYFLSEPRNLHPFAYIQNKLFVARRGHVDFYRQRLERFITQVQGWPAAETFRTRLEKGRVHVARELFGSDCLIVP